MTTDERIDRLVERHEALAESVQSLYATVWRPERIEKILPESQRNSPEVEELLEKGITPIFVPDDDPDHRGTVYDKPEDEDQTEAA